MEIISTSIINGKIIQTTTEKIEQINWEKDETPNFITPKRKIINNKKLREYRYNKYEHFTKFVNAIYPNSKNILDVGCGNAETSILFKQLGYNVTAIDTFDIYQLAILTHYSIPYIPDYFTEYTDISKYDLITGLHCCEAIEEIIRNCITNDKEFVVTICENNQGSLQLTPNKTRKDYINYLKEISNKIKMTKLPIYDPLEEEYWGETIYYKKR